ncbi:uncharacterized protein LOC128552264 [Mercenaria mercenaria]|uniref:uncharacterized protein LOC128552264 n=1 Tax=Mercenaria mercenaria TaxID=6596 RepID=UPI00234F07D4|nr:uncharacterized protein LOC128552264 [Mercenaria mercenaria]
MALARSFTESGSDEVRDGIVDACSYCATKGKLQPATHFCFDCGVYGRYICGECLQNHNMFVNNHVAEVIAILSSSRRKQLQTDLAVERRKSESIAKKLTEALQELDIHKQKRYDELLETRKKLEEEVNEKQERIFIMEIQLERSHTEQFKLQDRFDRQTHEFEGIKKKLTETSENNITLNKEKKQLEKKHEVHIAEMYDTMADEKRKHNSEMQKLTRDRDDIRDRLKLLTGVKLSEQNADIADLSDPYRAIEVSERFGQLYDDEWIDAFETLTEKKMGLSMKEAIAFLLRLVQYECFWDETHDIKTFTVVDQCCL